MTNPSVAQKFVETSLDFITITPLDDTPETTQNAYELALNEFDAQTQGMMQTQQGNLQNAIINFQGRVVMEVLSHVTKNAFDDSGDVLDPKEQATFTSELTNILSGFMGVVIPVLAARTIAARIREFGGQGRFKVNNDVKQYIDALSKKVSESHVTTIVEDLRKVIKQTYDANLVQEIIAVEKVKNPTLEINPNDSLDEIERKVSDDDLVYARKRALEGASQQRIQSEVTKKYNVISDVRAKAIARTEMNRAFTQSQFQADHQFLSENGLLSKAYKQWTTRSDNPCPICESLAGSLVPFTENFANLGDELTATYVNDKGMTKVLKQVVDFEPLDAGNAHVNCSCVYVLVVK